MKVTAKHLEMMRERISELDTPTARANYIAGNFRNADRVKNLDHRYRWDLFWAANCWDFTQLHDRGYTDAHIDTALRSIVPPLLNTTESEA